MHSHMQVLDSRHSWMRLAISVLIATIGNVGMWSVVVVLPMVQAEFGVDRSGASTPFTMTMIGFAIGSLVLGRFVDKWGIARPIAAATLLSALGFVLCGLAPSIWLFGLAHGVLIGFGTAIYFAPLVADISHWFLRQRGLAMAAAATGNYVAGTIWPPLMQPFLAAEGWRWTYIAIGITVAVTTIPLTLLLRGSRPGAGATDASGAAPALVRSDLSPRTLQALLFIAGLGCCVAMSMPQVHIVAYCVDLGYGMARGSEMLSLMLFGGIFSRLLSGWIADRIGGVRTLLIGSVGQGLALLFYIPFDGLVALYVVSLVFGLSQGGIVPSYAIIVREYMPANEAGQRVGVLVMATIIGMAIGGWMSGWIYDLTGSYAAAFLNGIAWNLLNLAMILIVLWRTRGPRLAAAAA